MRSILSLVLFFITTNAAFSQSNESKFIKTIPQDTLTEYVCIKVKGKAFQKKIKVVADFGDSDLQLKKGEEYSEILTNKKSYASILNFMAEKGYILLQTIEISSIHQGSGGTSGVIFIMKKD